MKDLALAELQRTRDAAFQVYQSLIEDPHELEHIRQELTNHNFADYLAYTAKRRRRQDKVSFLALSGFVVCFPLSPIPGASVLGCSENKETQEKGQNCQVKPAYTNSSQGSGSEPHEGRLL